MKKKDYEEQIGQFFKHNPVEDTMHLLQYVKEHPDNQMAWYLLGREYAARGEEGKAMYCFAKSGEVYEAFEENPAIPFQDELLPQSAALGTNFSLWGRQIWRIAAMTLLFLVVLFNPLGLKAPADESSIQAGLQEKPPGREQPGVSAVPEPIDEPATVENAEDSEDSEDPEDPEVSQPEPAPFKIYYVSSAGQQDRMEAALKQVILSDTAHRSLLLRASYSEDNKWVMWNKPPIFVLSAQRFPAEGTMKLAYYDEASCFCKPVDTAAMKPVYELWKQEQEQALVLMSAIAAYRAAHSGMPPESINVLISDYPNNVLSGYTEYMEHSFKEIGDATLHQEAAADAEGAKAEKEQQTDRETVVDEADFKEGSLPPIDNKQLIFEDPLEIIVDKQNHRLAVVSVSTIIRSYEVGLGGKKTPESQFFISEKVRNPNGKSGGEFGSRGMTLSNTLYAIHGTNQPQSIGKDLSSGCIRMLKEDLEELYDMVPKGTKVTIGKGILPGELVEGTNRFSLPSLAEETNPDKVYKWLQ